MLVLAATYYSPWLNSLVPSDRFQQLLLRTNRFLRNLAPLSPTCAHDCAILEKISRLLYGATALEQQLAPGLEFDLASTSNSFGSSF